MTPTRATSTGVPPAAPARAERPLHVLVVDDSAVVRQTLSSLFALEGIEATVAADPYIAMEKMSRQRPDVIVLDLELPRMHGLDFLARLMEEDPIPVVVCSALTGDGTDAAMRALEQGALAVVTKPKLNIREFLHESAVVFMDAVRGAAQARVGKRRPTASPRLTADAVLPARPGPGSGVPADRIVAVGASTGGTEALSTLLQAMPDAAKHDVLILASDIDPEMIARGEAGTYPAARLADIPAKMRGNAIETNRSGAELRFGFTESVRKLVRFRQLNLLREWPMRGAFNVIFCRNVMIYFDQQTQDGIWARFARQMSLDSVLYIGHSERIATDTLPFELAGQTAYRLKGSRK